MSLVFAMKSSRSNGQMYVLYIPDFVLDNGIIIETKGLFTSEDRRKHIEVQKQHPELDIRFVFTNEKINYIKEARLLMVCGAIKTI